MVRQYIGARYVPRFMGEYDSTQIYEALDVVDNGLGTSYIARKIVPAGTPLTNTDYWFIYGASTGAILDLQTRVGTLETGIVDLASHVETAGGLLVLGNSYVMYHCADYVMSKFAYSKSYLIGNIGFVPYSDITDDFEDCLDLALADATLDRDKITHILILSAMGDSRGIAQVTNYATLASTCISNIVSKATGAFPNLQDIAVTLGETRDKHTITSHGGSTWYDLFAIHQFFKGIFNPNPNIRYLGWSGFECLMNSSTVNTDHYHPNATGASIIGKKIWEQYLGTTDYKTLSSRVADYPLAVGGSGTVVSHLQVRINPDNSFVDIDSIKWKAGSITAGNKLMLQFNEDISFWPFPTNLAPNFHGAMVTYSNTDFFLCRAGIQTITGDTDKAPGIFVNPRGAVTIDADYNNGGASFGSCMWPHAFG